MWSACRWLSQCWLVFVLLGVDATLSDGFDTVSGNWIRVLPRLYGRIYKTFRLSPLVVEQCCCGYECEFPIKTISDWILWVANFPFLFYESWGLRHWRSQFSYRQVKILTNICLLFNSDIVIFVWKTDGGGAKHCFVDFCSLAVL